LLAQYQGNPCFEFALHGLAHVDIGGTEWLGVPYPIQCDMMEEGIDILRDALGVQSVRTFLPPWNSYDLNTVRAARQMGIEYLSGDAGLIRKSPLAMWLSHDGDYQNVAILPATCSLRELPDALEMAKADPGDTILVVVFHPYDFEEYHSSDSQTGRRLTLRDLGAIVASLSKDQRVQSMRIKDVPPAWLSAERYTACCRYCVASRLLARVLPRAVLRPCGVVDEGVGRWLPKGRYLDTASYCAVERTCLAWIAGFGGVAGVAGGWLAGRLIRKRARRRLWFMVYCSTGLLAFCGLQYRYEIATSPAMRNVFAVACALAAVVFVFMLLGTRRTRDRGTTAVVSADDPPPTIVGHANTVEASELHPEAKLIRERLPR
jgi:hypothetical protein